MREVNPHRLDLNLLKVFVALLETGSVTEAGARLGLAQSSMSHALARLRETLDDQLFVRVTTGMVPTPYADSIAEPIAKTLAELQAALAVGRAFDPLVSQRNFTLIMTDVVEMILLPRLMGHLATAAPHVQITGLQMPRSAYRDALESGQADLALGQLPAGHTDFYQQILLEQPFACFVRAGHPLEGRLDFDAYMGAQHLIVSPPAMAELHVKDALGARAAQRQIALRVPHYMVAPFVLASTDLVAVLPTTLINYFLGLGTIARLPLPFAVEPIVTRQFWHQRSHNDAACQWLRQTIASIFLGWDMGGGEKAKKHSDANLEGSSPAVRKPKQQWEECTEAIRKPAAST